VQISVWIDKTREYYFEQLLSGPRCLRRCN